MFKTGVYKAMLCARYKRSLTGNYINMRACVYACVHVCVSESFIRFAFDYVRWITSY